MFRPWVKFLVNHNMRFVVYFVWLIVLPLFLLQYIWQAAEDAMYEFESIKKLEKE